MVSPFSEGTALGRYTYNLMAMVQQETPSFGSEYEREIDKVFHVLLRRQAPFRRRDNPVIIEPNEYKRWHIITEITRRIVAGRAPDALVSYQVVGLDFKALCSKTLPSPQQ